MSSPGTQRSNAELYQIASANGWVVPASLTNPASLQYEQLSRQQQISQTVDQLPPPPPYPTNVKKKLYFSPEFLEYELMVDPPPLAEEFLYEVRRMIDLAKTRLRARRYMPRIPVIPEEGGDENRSNPGNFVPIPGMDDILEEEENEDILDMEEIVGIVRHPEAMDENEEDDSARKSPEGSGGSAESPDSGKTSGEGPSNSDTSKESAEKDSGIAGSPNAQTRKSLKSSDDSNSGVTQEQKVTHWLSKMPDESLDIEESPPSTPRKPVRHSKLFKCFAARQSQAAFAANAQDTSLDGGPSGSAPTSNDGVFRLTVDDGEDGEITGKTNHVSSGKSTSSSSSSFGSSALLKRYGISRTNQPSVCSSDGQQFPPVLPPSSQDLWPHRSPDYISRQQILSNHNYRPFSSPSRKYGDNTGVSVASLPRQFMRNQLPLIGGSLMFPANEKSLPFADSFPRIHTNKYSKPRPEIQPETYDVGSSAPPVAILPLASSQ